jgi:hypothetical protein
MLIPTKGESWERVYTLSDWKASISGKHPDNSQAIDTCESTL